MYQLHPINNLWWYLLHLGLQTNTLVKVLLPASYLPYEFFILVTLKESCLKLYYIRNVLVRNHVLVASPVTKQNFTQWLVKTLCIFCTSRNLSLKRPFMPLESSDIWDQLCAAGLWLLVPDLSSYVVVIQQWPSISQIVPFDKSSFCIHVLHTLPSANSVYKRVLTLQFPFLKLSLYCSQVPSMKTNHVSSVPPTSGVANASSWHSY